MFFFLTSTYPIAAQQTIEQANVRFPIFPIEQGPPTPLRPEFPQSGRLKAPPGELLKHRPFDNRTEYVDSYNFTVEHQLAKDMRVSVAYVGNVGRKLWRALNINAAQPAPGALQDRRPFFQLFGLPQTIQNGCNCENSNYNSLQWVVEKRFSEGYSLNSSFTWSKALDLRGAANPLDRRAGYGPSEFDRAAVWVLSHGWDLPYGNGRRFGSAAGGFGQAVLGGWRFHGISTLASGFPYTPTLSDRSTLNADFGQRPDIVGDPRVSNPTREGWYDPGAFQAPACCRLGNAGTNVLRGPGLFTVDWSFGKEFAIREKMRAELRWENFNFFNHANLAQPVNAVDSPVAGRILGLAGSQTFGGAGVTPMRRMQLGLRLTW
jgi:hypothetical protein